VWLPPRIRDEDVDRPKLAFDLATHGLDLCEFGRVRYDPNRPSARVPDLRVHCRQGGRIPAVNHDLRAALGEELSDRRADAAGGSSPLRTPNLE